MTRPPISGGSAAAGGAHSVLSLPDGRVLAWGKGSQGQLGNGDQRSRSAPTPVAGLSDITMVAAGRAHTLARSSAGLVYGWGANGAGQLGDGSIATRRRPVPVLLLKNVAAIAAGRAHSLALTADGRVFSWGANDQGQLGLGSTIDATIPTEITTLSGIVAIAAGHSHSLAITRTGELFAWGGNAQGQLGDGSRTYRVTPLRINLDGVVAIAAGRSHTLALLRSGDVYSWGRGTFGQLGTGSTRLETKPKAIGGLKAIAIETGANFSAAVRLDRVLVTWGANRSGQLGDGTTINRSRPVAVGGLVEIRALALGDVHAIAVTRNGSVQTWGDRSTAPLTTIARIDNWGPPLGTVETPTIEPASGVYTTAQTVALKTNGNFIEVRYTRDGTEPTPQSQLYVQPFVVSTATTVRARAFSTFGGVSDVSTALFAFQYGELAAPAITPGGGTFAQAPVVTITSLPGASIRYTLDGADPHHASTLYTDPIQIPSTGAHLKARAWHVDWSPSAIVSESYVTDITPPTIVAHVSPPLVDGWMTTPVTVTFACEDDSGHVACSAPVVVDTDGRDQLIRGTATDAAGNQASASVVVSVDLQPPSILVLDSPDQQSTSERDLTISARVTDAGSGVSQVSCNGDSVSFDNELVACAVMLRPGVNSITVQATDALGHMSSVGLTVSRIGVPSALRLSPAQRTMLATEEATFTLRDEYGVAVSGASWATSDPEIVTLSTDDPPLVTALAPGTATITAARDGLSAEAEVHVRAGMELDPGTTKWMVKATPGYAMKFPLYTTRVDATVPPLFLVESAVHGEATLYAATPDGEVLWQQDSPGVPLMGDSFGGVITGVLGEFQHSQYRAFVRLGNAGGVAPWRYNSPGRLLAPAQAMDGTIYAIEHILGVKHDGSEIWDKYATVIDGRSGQLLNRTLLAREIDIWITTSPGCPGRHREETPSHSGPIVGPDGRGYLLVRRYERTKTLVCHDEFRMPRTIDVGIDLFIMSAQQAPVTESIHSAQCVAARNQLVVCDAAVDAIQVLPDGIGGLLATWRRGTHLTDPDTVFTQTSVTRRTATGSFVDMPVPQHTFIYSVGQAGTALVIGPGTFSAIDVTSWATKWSHGSSAGWPIAADPDGGAALLHPSTGALSRITSAGDVDAAAGATLPLITAYHQFGGWIGLSRDGRVRSVVGAFTDATRWQPATGNVQGNLRLSTPGVGIFAKSHAVQEPITFQHVSIRITPTFQDFWKGLKPADFVNRDEFGNYFMTIGAGTAEGDTSFFCTGVLTKGINRENDVAVRSVNFEQLPVDALEEVRLINDLYVYFGNYKNDLPYACVPEMHPGKYNSNSFARGLLFKASAPLPLFPTRTRIAPGWAKPVPPEKFDP